MKLNRKNFFVYNVRITKATIKTEFEIIRLVPKIVVSHWVTKGDAPMADMKQESRN